MSVIKRADANPTKAFFVRMITKDILLEDCILDLIDNSIDGAWKLEGAKPMSLVDEVSLAKYSINLEVSPEHFKIVDNCGGITLDDAAEYAFTFGRKDSEKHEAYSIGVYGIGMKRAVFKMGESIFIRSTYTNADGAQESFVVPIKVDEWLQAKDWDFDIESSIALEAPGVEIAIHALTESSTNSFRDPAFIQRLKKMIARDYSLHLHRGLRILLNNQPISGWDIELREGGGFVPTRMQYQEETGGIAVSVEILAGMAAPPPESNEPDELKDKEGRFGWYVVCNGRIVLSADTTHLTGWGVNGAQKWHPQYAGFIGLIMFSSSEASALPLTTTKRSVDVSVDVYRRALPKMRDVMEKWISYTNERKQWLVEAKQAEESAKPKSIFNIGVNALVQLPKFEPRSKVQMANIAYSMPRDRVRKLAEGFGDINLSYRDVGIKSFDYAYTDHVGDD